MSKNHQPNPDGSPKKRGPRPAKAAEPDKPRRSTRARPTAVIAQPPAPAELTDPQPEVINAPDELSETAAMEVHHHPQLGHKPKPWKEYLLEGFMIFIAVMMGFIAENIREDITNSEHTRQLTSRLVHDLRSDTTQLNRIFREETKIINDNDSLFSLLNQPVEKIDIRKVQQLVAGSHSLWLFRPSSGAIGAIKNELHLKQLAGSDIISYISTYERHTELLRTVQDIALQYQRSFLDPFLRLHFTPDNLNAAFNHKAPLTGQMRNLKQEDLTQLRADMVLIRINTGELLSNNRNLMEDAKSTLAYVLKQYHPEAE